MASEEVKAAIALLRDEGFLVARIPSCKKEGRNHGSHILVTRSAKCPGGGIIPHGLQTKHLGTFGVWAYCLCGDSFSDYIGDEPSEWKKHQAEHPEFFEKSTKES